MNEIITEAREWIGTPFHHQGRLKGVGTDCVGLVLGVYGNVLGRHVLPEDQTDYGIEITEDLRQHLVSVAEEVPKSEMQEGDIMQIAFFRHPTHLAICAGETMIHAYSLTDKVVENRINEAWMSRVKAVWRVKWQR